MQISGIVSTVYGKYDTEMQKCIVTADDAYENLREEFVKENNLIESKKKNEKKLLNCCILPIRQAVNAER